MLVSVPTALALNIPTVGYCAISVPTALAPNIPTVEYCVVSVPAALALNAASLATRRITAAIPVGVQSGGNQAQLIIHNRHKTTVAGAPVTLTSSAQLLPTADPLA